MDSGAWRGNANIKICVLAILLFFCLAPAKAQASLCSDTYSSYGMSCQPIQKCLDGDFEKTTIKNAWETKKKGDYQDGDYGIFSKRNANGAVIEEICPIDVSGELPVEGVCCKAKNPTPPPAAPAPQTTYGWCKTNLGQDCMVFPADQNFSDAEKQSIGANSQYGCEAFAVEEKLVCEQPDCVSFFKTYNCAKNNGQVSCTVTSDCKEFDIDQSMCQPVADVFETKCNLGIEKPGTDSLAQSCNDQPFTIKKKIEQFADYGASPSEAQCAEMYTVFYAVDKNLPADPKGWGDTHKCIQELVSCATLFEACKVDADIIKINDLEAQCTEFLKGGAVKWDSLVGKNLCSDALKLQATVKEKCDAYETAVEEEKDKLGYNTDAKPGYQFDEEEEATRLANRAKLEALSKGTFQLLGDRSGQEVLGGAIKVFTGIMGSVALAMFVYGGFLIMTAAGNSDKISQGTQIVLWGGLGVVVVLSAYLLVNFVFEIIV